MILLSLQYIVRFVDTNINEDIRILSHFDAPSQQSVSLPFIQRRILSFWFCFFDGCDGFVVSDNLGELRGIL
jgi:hypothetical protein